MKFCVVIMDGASGWPLPQRGNKTCLELAHTPTLDAMAARGQMGMAFTVPPGMEPSSACACMSVMGYDPLIYYKGRASIEARSMGIPVHSDEMVFRCNLVTILDGIMVSYSSGHISTPEAKAIIESLNRELGSDRVIFFPGVSYRHICKLKGGGISPDLICTPPHDITDKPVADFLPRGKGSEILRQLMSKSEAVLSHHPVNMERKKQGKLPATTIWLFWPSGQIPEMPSFQKEYGLRASLTSGVDLLRGLAEMAAMEVLQINGVTDDLDNDYAAQAAGALKALERNDVVIIHIEAPDEMGHRGAVDDKIRAIELIDNEVMNRIYSLGQDNLKVLVMPDHPTPIEIKTHCADPVPFLIWGRGVVNNGCHRFTEMEAGRTGFVVQPGYKLMREFLKDD